MHIQISQFLTKILQLNYDNNFSIVKDSKGVAKCVKEEKTAPHNTLVSYDINTIFTSISVALEVINRKSTQHTNQKGTEHFLANTKYLLHTQGKDYLTLGTSTQQLCLLLGNILIKIPRSCNGFPCISSHC